MNLKKEYSKTFLHVKGYIKFILISLMLLAVFFIIGLFFPLFFKEEIINFITNLEDQISGMNLLELVLFIFKNNLQASFFVLLFGVILGIFPVFMIISNGYLIGFVLHFAILSEGPMVIWKLFPHGIFEIPAILISVGMGIKLGFDLLHEYIKKNKEKDISILSATFIGIISPVLLTIFLIFVSFKDNRLKMNIKNNFYHSVKVFILIIIPLLIIAAVIEGSLIYLFR